MFYTLLTLLLPYRATKLEVDFHTQFVICAYRDYYDRLVATGFRDYNVLAKIRNQTAYSMSFLFWYHPIIWFDIRQLHKRLLKLKKSVVPLDEIPKPLTATMLYF